MTILDLLLESSTCPEYLLKLDKSGVRVEYDFAGGMSLDKICSTCYGYCDFKELKEVLVKKSYRELTKEPMKGQIPALQDVDRVKELKCLAWLKHPYFVYRALSAGEYPLYAVVLAYRDLYFELDCSKYEYCFRIWTKNTQPPDTAEALLKEICEKQWAFRIVENPAVYSVAKTITELIGMVVKRKVSKEELMQKYNELRRLIESGSTEDVKKMLARLGELGLSAFILYYLLTHPAEAVSALVLMATALGKPVKVLAVKLKDIGVEVAENAKNFIRSLTADGIKEAVSKIGSISIEDIVAVAEPVLILATAVMWTLAVYSALNLEVREPFYALYYLPAIPVLIERGDLYAPALSNQLGKYLEYLREGIAEVLEKAQEEYIKGNEATAVKLFYLSTYYLMGYEVLERELGYLNVSASDTPYIGVKQLESTAEEIRKSMKIYELKLDVSEEVQKQVVKEGMSADVLQEFIEGASKFVQSLGKLLENPLTMLLAISGILILVPLILEFLGLLEESSKD